MPFPFFTLLYGALGLLALAMLARFILQWVLKEHMAGWRNFLALTNPVVGLTRAITPAVLPSWLLPLLAAFWLQGLRVELYMQAGARGWL